VIAHDRNINYIKGKISNYDLDIEASEASLEQLVQQIKIITRSIGKEKKE